MRSVVLAAGCGARAGAAGWIGAGCCAAVFAIVAMALAGCARKQPPVPVVGVLMVDDFRQPTVDGLVDQLTEFDYLPDRNIRYVVKNAKGDTAAMPGLARDLVALRPNVICPVGGVGAQACIPLATNAGIPVVYMGVTHPKDLGIAVSDTQPLPNTTGVRTGFTERMPKRLELITFFFPTVKTVTVLYTTSERPSVESLALCEEAGPKLGLAITGLQLNNDADARQIAASMSKEKYELLLGTPNTALQRARKAVVIPAAVRAGIRFFGIDRDATLDGAEVSYGPSLYSFGTQGARMVLKVLQGTRPETMPIELPDTVELSVNMKTARQIGLEFPPRMLGLADFMIR